MKKTRAELIRDYEGAAAVMGAFPSRVAIAELKDAAQALAAEGIPLPATARQGRGGETR